MDINTMKESLCISNPYHNLSDELIMEWTFGPLGKTENIHVDLPNQEIMAEYLNQNEEEEGIVFIEVRREYKYL